MNLAAHARLMYREMVTVEDAVMAVSVMECSMQVREPPYHLNYDQYHFINLSTIILSCVFLFGS